MKEYLKCINEGVTSALRNSTVSISSKVRQVGGRCIVEYVISQKVGHLSLGNKHVT